MEVNHHWQVFGVSHKKADYTLRKQFSLDKEAIDQFYQNHFPAAGVKGFILSTCNRTTFFIEGGNAAAIEKVFASMTTPFSATFEQVVYRFHGKDALRHFYEVGCGLDSQIPGDFEIIGQMKKAFGAAKQAGVHSGQLEKLMNSVIRASRRIKNETSFSSGTASVSYAAVRYLRDHLHHFSQTPVLIVGLGDIGTQVLDNLVKHKDAKTITVCNRTQAKSHSAVKKYGVQMLDFASWKQHLGDFGAIITASASDEPLIEARDFTNPWESQILIDLGMPANISAEAALFENKTLMNVDQISAFINHTLENRKDSIPKARHIIDQELQDYLSWERARHAFPLVKQISLKALERWRKEDSTETQMLVWASRVEGRLFGRVRRNPEAIEGMKRWIQTHS